MIYKGKTGKINDIGKIDCFLSRNRNRKVVVIQGLGFVGIAMLTAVASAKDRTGRRRYAVIGVDLPAPSSYWKIGAINRGSLTVKSSDRHLHETFRKAHGDGNVMATADTAAYRIADVVVIDINLDKERLQGGRRR